MALSAGSRLGPYEILSPLGAGGMGEVYRARDARLDRDVAVKVLPSRLAEDPVALARFEREAKAVAATSHPNILAIFDVGRSDGIAFAVTELLDGETLRGRLGAGPIPARKAIEYAVQIAEGLAAAHDKGIVHRDVKPENLFVMKDGRIKILDFGLARQVTAPKAEDTNSPTLSRHTEPGTVMGTMGYMSPEQVRGKPADQRSDLFSFGAVLYEMLTGRRAFQGETPADTLTAILTKEPAEISTPEATLSPTIDRIVRRCLERDPEARFRSAHDLGFALATLSGLSRPGMPTADVERVSTQRPLRVVSLALIVIALVAGAFVIGGRLEKTPLPSFRQLTFRRGTVSSARFTPDGQTIVYSAAWEGGLPEVFTTRPDTVESRPLGLANTTLVATAPGEMAVVQHTVHTFQGTLARISLAGGVPREVREWVWDADWTPDGLQFAVVGFRNGKSQLEFPIGRVLYQGGGTAIRNVRISPRGDEVALIDQWGGAASIVVVDASARSRILSKGWESAEGLAWSPDGREIWFTASREGAGRALHAVGLSGKERVIARTTGTLTLQDIFHDGRVLLTETRSRGEAWGLAPGATRERDLSWLDDTAVADVSDDGKSFVFVDRGSVYLRRTDGSAPVRLGPGTNAALSPDGKFVISSPQTSPNKLTVLPTGAGEARTLPPGTVYDNVGVWWFPDGKRILILGREQGLGVRVFIQSLDEGLPRPLTPEGSWPLFATRPISPDGKLVTIFTASGGTWTLRATDGSGETRSIPGLRDSGVLAWSGDGRYLFVRRNAAGLPARIQRLDLKAGRLEPWRDLGPADAAGVRSDNLMVFLTPDGRSYLYSYRRDLSDLYLVEGLK
jgi:serine/threonine protein kinase/Tol biopolymer transport system component